MRNIKLFVICCCTYVGVFAQQEELTPLLEYTSVTTEVKDYDDNNKASRVDNIKYSIEEYESMIVRCKELTARLVHHKQTVRKGSMSKSQYRAWQRDLVEAKMLNFRIDDFNMKFFEQDNTLLDRINKESLSSYYDFSKVLESSMNYAGL